jgi:hypothetical protein
MNSPDDDLLLPPKRKLSWRKVGLILFGSLFLLLIGIEVLWGWAARRQLDAEIAAIRASGEPIDAKDFQTAAIPDADNAAWYYQKAAEATHYNDLPNAIQNLPGSFWTMRLTDEETATIYANLESDKPVLDLIAQAEKHEQVVWPMPKNNGTPIPDFPELNTQRTLCNTITSFAWMQHNLGQDDLAVQRVIDSMRQADALSHYYPSLVSNLVSVGIGSLGAYTAMELAPRLNIAGSRASTRPMGASTQQVKELIAILLEEKQFRASAKRALSGEDKLMLDFAPTITGGGIRSFFLSPVMTGDSATLLHWNRQTALSFDEPNWPSAQRKIPDISVYRNGSTLSSLLHAFSGMLAAGTESNVKTHFRALTERRAAAIFLAMALWRADHPNSWPKSLSELTPDYLQSIPLDPFSPNNAAFPYKPDSAVGPIIYSVGEDGVDDGGSEQTSDPNPRFAREPNEWGMKDRVYHLIPPPPTSRPAES